MVIEIDEAERRLFLSCVKDKLQKEIQNPKATSKRLVQLYKSEDKLKSCRK